MDESFKQTLTDYIWSGHAYVHAPTSENARFLSDLKEIAETLPSEGRPVFVWSPTTGWQDAEGNPAQASAASEPGPPSPQMAAQQPGRTYDWRSVHVWSRSWCR